MAYFRINGLDILPYIKDGGFNYEGNDLDSEDAGRTLDSIMHRGKIAEKATWQVELRPVPVSITGPIYDELVHEFVTVETDIHPRFQTVTLTMYNSKRTTKCLTIYPDGQAMWEDFSFNLIEQ